MEEEDVATALAGLFPKLRLASCGLLAEPLVAEGASNRIDVLAIMRTRGGELIMQRAQQADPRLLGLYVAALQNCVCVCVCVLGMIGTRSKAQHKGSLQICRAHSCLMQRSPASRRTQLREQLRSPATRHACGLRSAPTTVGRSWAWGANGTQSSKKQNAAGCHLGWTFAIAPVCA